MQISEDGVHALLTELYPLHRSLIAEGTRRTQQLIAAGLRGAQVLSYPSGTRVGDWTIPQEWKLNRAQIAHETGEVVCDVSWNNLHVVQYSSPLDAWIGRDELPEYVFTDRNPEAIPYVTSYYGRRPGFCMSQNALDSLPDGRYHMVIDSEFCDSNLDLLQCFIPGQTDREVLLWAYVCHPSMVNNELSGPVVLRMLAEWLLSRDCHYSYRLVWSVETIGAIAFLSDHLERIRPVTVGGLVVNCLGGPGAYTVIGTPSGARFIDRAMGRAMESHKPGYESVTYLLRDSDERQLSSNRAQLPILGFCKTKPGQFPEYHTSLDDLSFVSAGELIESFQLLTQVVERLESDSERIFPLSRYVGEPFLSKRLPYPTESTGTINDFDETLKRTVQFLAYSDGDHSIADIAARCGMSEAVALETWKHLHHLQLVAESHELPR